MDIFKLSPLEKKKIRSDIKQITSQRVLPIAYYTENFNPNSSTSGEWSNYDNYRCGVQEVDATNIKRYDYGDIQEGDAVILLPYDTDLIEGDKYKFKYKDDEYTTDDGLIIKDFPNGDIAFYMLVGRR